MSDSSQGPGWWLASDGKWYPPLDAAPAPGWWLASDGQWYPPTQRSAADPQPDEVAEPARTSEPVAEAEPAPAKPAPAKPVPAKPAAAKPVPAKPAAKPAAAKPVPAKPAAAKPAAAKPAAAKPVPAKPAAAKPAAAAPAPAATPPARPTFRRTPADPEQQIRKQNEQSRQTNAAMAAARAAAATRALKSLQGQIADDLQAAKTPVDAERSVPTPASPPTKTPASTGPTSPSSPAESTERAEPTTSNTSPLLEVKGSALASDIENIGERIALFDDRVELRDRSGATKHTIYGAEIADVVVHKKLAGCTVTIESGTGDTITAKGLKPEQAEEIRSIVLKHTRQAPRPEGVPAPVPPVSAVAYPVEPTLRADHSAVSTIDEVALAQKLDDLYRAGVLNDIELADKLELLRSLARNDATVSTTV